MPWKTSSAALGFGSLSWFCLIATADALAAEGILPEPDDRPDSPNSILPTPTASGTVPMTAVVPEVAVPEQRIELTARPTAAVTAPAPEVPQPSAPAVQTISQLTSPSTTAADLLPAVAPLPIADETVELAPANLLTSVAAQPLVNSTAPSISVKSTASVTAPTASVMVPTASVTVPTEPVSDERSVPLAMDTDTQLDPPAQNAPAPNTIAQSDTQDQNTGKLPLPAPTITPVAPTPETLIQPESASPKPVTPPASPATDRVLVKRIEVVGSTVLSAATIAQIVQPFEGQSLTFQQLQNVVEQLTQRYLQAGYLTSRALLKAQTVEDGKIQIDVLEGSLAQVDIMGNQRLSDKYIRRRIQRGIQTPLNQPQLEDQLRLLKLDPLLSNLEASLRQGEKPGQSILTVRVAEAAAVFGSLSFDNDSVPSVGSERAGITLGYRNLTGAGDLLYGSYYRSLSGGANLWDFGYQLPLNSLQGTLNLRVAPSRYRITNGEFKDFDISGSSGFYDVSVRQPLWRSPREEVALTLGFGHRTGQTLVSDFLVDESVTSVVRFGQDWLRRDTKGFWSANSQFNFGTKLLGATQARSPDGQFFSWTGQLARTQFLNPDNVLRLQANWQLTPDALLPSQQFVMGGRQSLRGFRQNFRSGDNGVSLSIEHQVTLKRNAAGVSVLQLAPFFETGVVWNAANNPSTLPDQTWLAGLGVGLRWQPTEKWDMRLDYGLPLVRPSDRGGNLQDAAVYFNVKYRF
ncbi:BamA/TamA family outer membrane protein [filamentous cyanobacterium LEGE 11480]|uniref:BamA/TamA family outer membrane protein n=2 Tax=Romeriopsis TaxID=2992131 RepID=A0A928Z6H6_9CYAN|nr:BamA/TamA family outer membrane protein [Romeriopsis navalis LEGE 11480]